MWPEGTAKSLTRQQRDFLIRHIDRPCPVPSDSNEVRTANALRQARLIRPSNEAGDDTGNIARPRFYALTENGRATLAWILAEYAEALIRSGCLSDEKLMDTAALVPRINRALTELLYRHRHAATIAQS